MANEKLLDAKEITESSDLQEVNELLKSGWKMFDSYSIVPYASTPDHQEKVYCLGRFE